MGFDKLPDTTPGEGEDTFEKAVQALTNYFTPRQNREYELYVSRQAKQESNESISGFHTRLRQLAVTCEFADVDREIKPRTKALENPSYTLTQLLDAGRVMELSQKQAANIEESQTVNKLSSHCGIEINGIGTPKLAQTKMADAQLTRSHAKMVTRSGNQVISSEIAVETAPIPEEKHLSRLSSCLPGLLWKVKPL